MSNFELVTKTYVYDNPDGSKRTIKRNYYRKQKKSTDERLREQLKEYCLSIENTKGKTSEQILSDFNTKNSTSLDLKDVYDIVNKYSKTKIENTKNRRYQRLRKISSLYFELKKKEQDLEQIKRRIVNDLQETDEFVTNCIKIIDDEL